MAPIKGSIRNRILFGHLLGLGFRHSSNGFVLGFGGPSDMHLLGSTFCLDVKKLGCSARRWAQLGGRSKALRARCEGRKEGMMGN